MSWADFDPVDSDVKVFEQRYKWVYLTIVLAVSVLILRLWFLQITSGSEMRLFSEKNRIKESKVMAPRGIIYDSDGRMLAENIPGFEAVITPQYTKDLKATAHAVAKTLKLDAKDIIEKVKSSRAQSGTFFPCRIKDNLNRNEVFQLKMLRRDHPGLDIRQVIVRNYPLSEMASHVLGYVGEISKEQIKSFNEKNPGPIPYSQGDVIGKNGIERSLETSIRGIDGISFTQVDAMGREASQAKVTVFGRVFEDEKAISGNLIHTTIDMDIQRASYQAFVDRKRTGGLIAMRPTGEILALVSFPAFDPNVLSRGVDSKTWNQLIKDPMKPLTNKVLQFHNSPGSSFKPFVAMAGLAEKVVNPHEKQLSPGFITFGRRVYHDHQKGGHGYINLFQALERSSNVYFYRLGIDLGIDKMHAYISRLGIGQKTGIELDGEVAGLMPSADWKKTELGEVWQGGENLSTAIGQGFVLTTPIQMAKAYAAIGLEGKLYQPYLVSKVIAPGGQVVLEKSPQLLDDLTRPDANGLRVPREAFQDVKRGLWRVSNGEAGTARWYKVPGVEMGGKTGTSQIMSMNAEQLFAKCDERPLEQRHHGWFVAMAPVDKPEIVVAVFAEHACAGSSGAAPLARDVMKAYFDKYPPQKLAEVKPK